MDSYENIEYTGSGEAEDVLAWAFAKFGDNIAIASSFEAPVLIHMSSKIFSDVRIFSIDTGRLPEETYQCAEDIKDIYNIKTDWYFPRNDDVEVLEREEGLYSFKKSLEARHKCCGIRKVEPLSRALNGLNAWITSLRKDQSITRNELNKVEIDDAHGGIVKINPIADWSDDRVKKYISDNKIPYNRLLDKGYMSIGCSCCTRAVRFGDNVRSGRWWWEGSEHKECGLHINSDSQLT